MDTALVQLNRGYRSNRFLDQVRPTVHEKQKWFLSIDHLECLYGGAAGGGKSDALLMAALQYVDIPGYAAILFRRTYEDLSLPGALMDRANLWLSKTDALKRDGGKRWEFPEGGTLQFAYLDNPRDRFRYQGAEFQFCVEVGTPVLMGNGAYKTIETLQIGDMVQTLCGPRKVTRTFAPVKKECVSFSGPYGKQIHPIDHRILTVNGWDSYAFHLSDSCEPRRTYASHTPSSETRDLDGASSTPFLETSADQPRAYERVQSFSGLQLCEEKSVSSTDARSDSLESDDDNRVALRPLVLTVLAVLYEPLSPSKSSDRCNEGHLCGTDDGQSGSSQPDSLTGCQSEFCSYDGQSRHCGDTCRGNLRRSDDVETPSRLGDQPLDVLENTPEYNLLRSGRFFHPYTKETLSFADTCRVSVAPCRMTPVGVRTVVDVTIEDVNHYITSSNFINSNCAFDEVSQIHPDSYKYLFSRLRRPNPICSSCEGQGTLKHGRKTCPVCGGSGRNPLADVPLRMRSASNPGGEHGESVKHAFITKKYIRSDEDFQFSRVWAKESACQVCDGSKIITEHSIEITCPICEGRGQMRRYFVPARLQDNPSVDQISYRQGLANLAPQERAQLEHGRWDLVSDGVLFKAAWIRPFGWQGEHIWVLTEAGKKVTDSTLIWFFSTADTASSTKTTADYTVICTWAVLPNWSICLVDVTRDRFEIPEIVPELVNTMEKWDSRFLIIEEASSGIAIIQQARYDQNITHVNKNRVHLDYGKVVPFKPHGSDKVHRAQDAMVRMKNGMIFFPERKTDRLVDCINEMLTFDGLDGSAHDDFIDNLAMAGSYIASQTRMNQNSTGLPPANMIRGGVHVPRYRQY